MDFDNALPAIPPTTDAVRPGTGAMPGAFSDPSQYEHMRRVAADFSKSQLVPAHFRERPHDILIALEIAQRLGAAPMLVLQNLYIVHGAPAWKATFCIAQAHASGRFRGPIRYRFEGDLRKLHKDGAPEAAICYARATLADCGEEVEAEFDIATARAEGWTSKNGSKYKTMAKQMMCYRAASNLIRLYAPEVMLGYYTTDEVEDFAEPPRRVVEVTARGVEGLGEAMEAAAEVEAPEPEPEALPDDEDADEEPVGEELVGRLL